MFYINPILLVGLAILSARALIWLIGYQYQKMEEGFRIYVNAGKLLQNLPQTELANNWEKDLLDTIKANFKYVTGKKI